MKSVSEHKSLTADFAYIQGFFWMSFAAILGFTSIYLLDAGFSNTQIGLLIAAAGAISSILQPVLAGFADKPDSPSLKKLNLLLAGFLLLCSAVLLLFYKRSMVFTGILYGSCITVLQLMLPFINALGMESINQGKKLNFGVSRGMGSVTYAILAYVLGAIVAKTGAISVPVSMLLIHIFLIFALLRFPFTKVPKSSSTEKSASGSSLEFFKSYKKFGIVRMGTTLLYIGHVLLNNFTFQIVASKGGGSSEMGVAMALSAIIELPTLFLFGYMVKKIRCDIWFRIAGVFFMLKALGTLAAPSILPFYLVQFLQLGGWALMTVASVYYVNSIMKEHDVIKGQAYMTMTYTLGSVIGSLIGGSLLDNAGVGAMLTFATASSFIGMLLVLLATEKTPLQN